MRIVISAIGRARRGLEPELVEKYLERARALGRGIGVSEIQIREVAESSARTPELRCADEARRLLPAVAERAVVVALDAGGAERTSEGFARDLRRWRDGGASELAFLLGGPDGHGAATLARAAFVLSLGRMTWPHLLARVLLAEQIYRAFTILTNHPYHRG